MTATRNLWQRYRQLPRAGRWAITALVAVAVFLVWNDYVLTLAAVWNERADELLADVREVKGDVRREARLRAAEDAIRALGPVQGPGTQSEAAAAVNDAVNEILKRHSVSDDRFDYRGAGRLPRGTLSDVVRSGQQVQRITGDLRFDASADEAVAIIAELEDSPRIEAVSDVHIRREAGAGKVRVDLTVEAWFVSFEQRGGRTGGG
jgi:hypothetical protein